LTERGAVPTFRALFDKAREGRAIQLRGAFAMPATNPDELRALGKRLDEIHRRDEVRKIQPPPTALGIGLRFATEMVAAVLVGTAMGWGLDWLFGTSPIFVIVMFLFGAGAGILNITRASKEINQQIAAGPAKDKKEQ
jgi:ATP synthase protein I